MVLKRLFLIASGTLLISVSQPFWLNFPMPFDGSLVVAQTTNARKAEADRLLDHGVQQYQTSQFQAALQSWQQALIIYREIKDRQSEGKALGNLGGAYLELKDYSKAIEYSQQRLTIAREIKDRQGEEQVLGNLGLVYLELRDYPKAIEYSQQSLAIAREIKDRQSERKALGNLSLVYLKHRDYPKAIEYSQQLLAIAREIKHRKSEAIALGDIGVAYLELKDYPKAVEYSQQSLAIARENKDRQSEGQALDSLGYAYLELKDYPKAIDYSQQSWAIARKMKARQAEANALGNLSGAYFKLRDYPKATKYSQQWLTIAREIKDRKGELGALFNLGNAYLDLRDYPNAIKYDQQSLTIAREIKDRQSEGQSLGNLGATYLDLGDYPKAIEYFQQSLAIVREIKDRQSEANALGNLGTAYRYLGNYTKAIEYQQQTLAIARQIKDRQGEANALGNLGGTYPYLGDHAKAIEYFQQSLAIAREIKDRQSESLLLVSLGATYGNLGDYAKVIEYSQKSLAIAREIKDRQSEGKALNNLGTAFYKQGNLNLAESNLFEAINVRESLRGGLDDRNKVSIFETLLNTYTFLQQVLIAQNKTDAALEIAERGRARAFVELLASRLNSQEKPKASTIQEMKQIALAQKATLVQYSITYDQFKIAGKPQIKESELYIWIVKPTGEVTFRKADLKSLWQKQNTSLFDLVTATRESMGVDDRSVPGRDISRSLNEYNRSIFDQKVIAVNEDDQAKSLQQLHQLLITPISDILPTDPNQRVIFVPQKELFLVPFAALRDKQGKYLIEKHTILTSPSIQVLELTHQQREKVKQVYAKDAIVVGNPTMPSVEPKYGEKPKQLPALPGTEKEAIAIAPLLNTKALTGNAATKAAILARLPQAKILHLATHGLFDDFQGLQSAVALAPSGGDNGLLTAEEILNPKLTLNADLVVLSACNTGRGRITGDGVIGLSRSLISAGTPSVIVSLWSVPDAPTAELMTDFYTNLYKKRLDKAQALRQAMLKLKNKEPKNWAAFTLIGEAE